MRRYTPYILALIGLGLLLSACGRRLSQESDHSMEASKTVRSREAPSTAPLVFGSVSDRTVPQAAFEAMTFHNYGTNPFIDADEDNLSTFAVDVDTGSYTLCRNYLNRGALPPMEAARTEEFINYFNYGYASSGGEAAVTIHTEAAPSAFRENKTVLRVGLQGRRADPADRKPATLTFVIDVSGSMNRENRLGLVKQTLELLVEQMTDDDEIGIAIYGSRGAQWLEHTNDQREILSAIDRLKSEGSTNAEEGLKIGYTMAGEAFREGATNRVILCSDGVANVGKTGPDGILKEIASQADKGITLTTVGVGMGNYNDVLMEQLADDGDGNYYYVDTLKEARRIFVDELPGTLELIARDAKVQVAFNTEVVRSYRLIGYENRDIPDEEFRENTDAGEMGLGHAVTALYELRLWPDRSGTLATVTVRYKDEGNGGQFVEQSQEVHSTDLHESFAHASDSLQLATSVAQFCEILRSSYWAQDGSLDAVAEHLETLKTGEGQEDVEELIELVGLAKSLGAEDRTLSDPNDAPG
jgi:Ca-activated chloride channel homolog